MTPPKKPNKVERRRERILRICDELVALGVSEDAVRPPREYAEGIRYCACGHEDAGVHGNGLVDRRCFAAGCDCKRFTPEADLVLHDHNEKEAARDGC